MNFNEVKYRNELFLRDCIERYKLKVTFERLMSNFTTIYSTYDFNNQRLRVIGIERTSFVYVDEEGWSSEDPYSVEKKRIQLFVMGKKEYKYSSDQDKREIIKDFTIFVSMFRQLKNFQEIEQDEAGIASAESVVQAII